MIELKLLDSSTRESQASITVVCVNPDDELVVAARIQMLINRSIGISNEDLSTMPGSITDMAAELMSLHYATRAAIQAAQSDDTWAAFREGILSQSTRSKPSVH